MAYLHNLTIEAQLALHLRASCAPSSMIPALVDAIDAINVFDEDRDIDLNGIFMTARDLVDQYGLSEFTIENAIA